MRQQSREYIVILFIVGVLALNYPIVELFDRSWMPFGVPLLYFYLYVVWLALIILLILVVQHSEIIGADPSQPPPDPAPRQPVLPAKTEAEASDSAEPH
ncbi:MAG TPA: hypothetical protein PKI41_10395 [Candidatus Competibacteraceae bacterium]|nr:hypothetical protein [Candidatus Competibacteraceae bacterium]HQD56523.1 hypothetical protein [Candidatus Competibacteraceae bacterium]